MGKLSYEFSLYLPMSIEDTINYGKFINTYDSYAWSKANLPGEAIILLSQQSSRCQVFNRKMSISPLEILAGWPDVIFSSQLSTRKSEICGQVVSPETKKKKTTVWIGWREVSICLETLKNVLEIHGTSMVSSTAFPLSQSHRWDDHPIEIEAGSWLQGDKGDVRLVWWTSPMV